MARTMGQNQVILRHQKSTFPRANGRASGPVLTSLFLVDPDHSGGISFAGVGNELLSTFWILTFLRLKNYLPPRPGQRLSLFRFPGERRAGFRRRKSERVFEEVVPLHLQLHHVPRLLLRLLESGLPDVRQRTQSL